MLTKILQMFKLRPKEEEYPLSQKVLIWAVLDGPIYDDDRWVLVVKVTANDDLVITEIFFDNVREAHRFALHIRERDSPIEMILPSDTLIEESDRICLKQQ